MKEARPRPRRTPRINLLDQAIEKSGSIGSDLVALMRTMIALGWSADSEGMAIVERARILVGDMRQYLKLQKRVEVQDGVQGAGVEGRPQGGRS